MGRLRDWWERSLNKFEMISGRDIAGAAKAASESTRPEAADAALGLEQQERFLRQTGVDMPATVRRIRLGQASPRTNGRTPVALDVTIEPPGGEVYDLHIEQLLPDAKARSISAGEPISVRVAPGDPQCALVW